MGDLELGGVDLDSVDPVKTLTLAAIPDVPPDSRWLVEGVWPSEAVGVAAATAKVGKTWIVADLGISVATGTPFAGRFPVRKAGKVLMFACEDRNHEMKDRVHGLAAVRGLSLADIAFELVDEPLLTLNRPKDLARLERRIRDDKPVLVILDPLRRVFSGNESSSDGVSSLFAQLRRIQRQYHVAVLLTHHVSKKSEFEPVSGRDMRGSGDIHAWGDANLFAWRSKHDENAIVIRMEYRNSPPQPPFLLRRVPATTPAGGSTAYLEHADINTLSSAHGGPAANKDELQDRVLTKLGEAGTGGIGFNKLREQLGVGAQKVSAVLAQLQDEGRATNAKRVWTLSSVPIAPHGEGPIRNGAGTKPGGAGVDRTNQHRVNATREPSKAEPTEARGAGAAAMPIVSDAVGD